MDDTPATLLLTRPDPQSQAFLTDCETRLGRRLPVVVSPLMRIEPMGEVPDLGRYATIILTSGNGVRRLGSALAGRRVATVGERTAQLARSQGAHAVALGADTEAFVGAAEELETPALHCRGVHSRGDLAQRMTCAGKPVDEVILYDQVAVPLSNAARMLLAGTVEVVAPVFSPRTAQLLSSYQIDAPITVVAISKTTAEAWTAKGKVRIAARPDAASMCALVSEALS